MSIIANPSAENQRTRINNRDRAHLHIVPRRGAILYLAAPLSTYSTPRYGAALLWLRANAPCGVPVIGAHEAWRGNADWCARWPALLARLAGLVFIADEVGYIGAGVWREIGDALAAGLPVLYQDDTGDVHPYRNLHFGPANPDNWRRYRRVMLASAAGVAP